MIKVKPTSPANNLNGTTPNKLTVTTSVTGSSNPQKPYNYGAN
jgi:hypothetical protein